MGKTALHAAMGQNRSNIADLLVSTGASLNAKDARGMTPLHECAYRFLTPLLESQSFGCHNFEVFVEIVVVVVNVVLVVVVI
jgi:ankyrin repeat protein